MTTRSPLNLVQEIARDMCPVDRTWAVLIACALLNKTHGRQVRPMVEELLTRWPTPAAMRAADEGELIEILRPLGLYRRRARVLRDISADRMAGRAFNDVRWCGPYAQASVMIVVHGSLDCSTDDPWLLKYLEWRRSTAKEAA